MMKFARLRAVASTASTRLMHSITVLTLFLVAYSGNSGLRQVAAAQTSILQGPQSLLAWRPWAPKSSIKLANGPIRQYWPEHHGYCGEFSVQVAAAYHGHWVSQPVARWLAGGEVLIADREGENMLTLLTKLGLSYSYWRKQPVEGGGLQRYLLWVKQQINQGRAVVFPARIADGADPEYDHLMPMYGVKTSSPSEYSSDDVFIWTTGERREIARSPSARGFFADSPEDCRFSLEEGGCISSNTPTYGAAVAGIPDSHGLYLPVRLQIDGWADGTPGYAEPRNGNVLASYSLDLRPAAGRLGRGDWFTVFRFSMVKGQTISKAVSSGATLANKPSLASLQQLCAAAGRDCESHSAKVTGSVPPVLHGAEEQLGSFPATSVVFFVAVKGK